VNCETPFSDKDEMAHSSAISCVCKALLKSLEDSCPKSEFMGTPAFEIYQTESFTATPPTVVTEGFTIFPWRILPNAQLRNRTVRRDPALPPKRPSLAVDIHLLATPWASEPERQLRLLGWMMRHFEDRPQLDANFLNSSPTSGGSCFLPDEMVELVCDPLAIADLLGLWDKFKPRLPASMTYVARGILLDSEIEMPVGAPVQTRTVQYRADAENRA
jgi:hypothetical protein